jgi:hypothetical protein
VLLSDDITCGIGAGHAMSAQIACVSKILSVNIGPIGANAVDRPAIKTEIKQLVKDGFQLLRREVIANQSEEQRKRFIAGFDGSVREGLAKKPHFVKEYQDWYSPALRVVEQLLPDRYSEFRALYQDERRKVLNLETYGIADYVASVQPASGISGSTALTRAMTCFERQIAILNTADSRLDSVLTDIGRTLHAEILDGELGAARSLLAASQVRSAGVVAGVALEGHLKKLISDHRILFRKTGTLSNLNEALKGAGIYDAPQWRQIQYLVDIRNLCSHKGDRDPTRDEVEALINEVAKIAKNLF